MKIQDTIRNAESNPGIYSLLGRQCVGFLSGNLAGCFNMKIKQIKICVVSALLFCLSGCGDRAEQELLKEVPAVIEQATASYEVYYKALVHAGELGYMPEDEVKEAQKLTMMAYQKAAKLREQYGESDLAAIPEGRKMLSESRYTAMLYYSKLRAECYKLMKLGIISLSSIEASTHTWGFFIVTMREPAKHEDTIERICEFWGEMDKCFEKIAALLNEVDSAESAAAKYDEVLSLYEKTKMLQGVLYEYTLDDPDWRNSDRVLRSHERLVDRIKNDLIPAEQRLKEADYYGIQAYRAITIIDREDNIPVNIGD